jgi:TPR repeat protein
MKRVVSLVFAAATLVICGAAKAGDVEDCRNAEALLKANPSRAVSACRRLADQGDAHAQFALGFMYDRGYGVQQDYAEAMRWYHKAADQGLATAQFSTAFMYNRGYGVQRDYDEAMRWYRKAADQGDAGAQYNVAFMYATGRGVRMDLVQAYMWFDLAGRSATPGHQGYAIQYRDSIASKMTPDQIATAKKLAADWRPKPSQ